MDIRISMSMQVATKAAAALAVGSLEVRVLPEGIQEGDPMPTKFTCLPSPNWDEFTFFSRIKATRIVKYSIRHTSYIPNVSAYGVKREVEFFHHNLIIAKFFLEGIGYQGPEIPTKKGDPEHWWGISSFEYIVTPHLQMSWSSPQKTRIQLAHRDDWRIRQKI